MKTLLITAFEPFGGESENPSALALGLLPETIGAAYALKSGCLRSHSSAQRTPCAAMLTR